MTALSIRHMRFTLRMREQDQARRDAEAYAALPDEVKAEPLHYWHVERKAKRGKNKWIFVREFFGSKRDAAGFWARNYQGRSDVRLHHVLEYGAKHVKHI